MGPRFLLSCFNLLAITRHSSNQNFDTLMMKASSCPESSPSLKKMMAGSTVSGVVWVLREKIMALCRYDSVFPASCFPLLCLHFPETAIFIRDNYYLFFKNSLLYFDFKIIQVIFLFFLKK